MISTRHVKVQPQTTRSTESVKCVMEKFATKKEAVPY